MADMNQPRSEPLTQGNPIQSGNTAPSDARPAWREGRADCSFRPGSRPDDPSFFRHTAFSP